MANFWEDNTFLVTGGHGFLGSYLCEKLYQRGARKTWLADRDLREISHVRHTLKKSQPTIVIHLAANVGGIEANRNHPAEFFYDNLIMGAQLLHEAYETGVKKFVTVGSVCAYPKHTPVPFREESLWNGYPEETNAPYGMAKKVLLVQGQAYRDQYGFNAIYLLPTNLYGPRDNFDPASSHVIPALIRKAVYAKQHGDPQMGVWGSGAASREFLYVEDAAEAILCAAERYDGRDPVNVGAAKEIKIRELVNMIIEEVGYQGALVWDHTKPDGQPRRCLDTSRAQKAFGWKATTDFREGLRRTIAWYVAEHQAEKVR